MNWQDAQRRVAKSYREWIRSVCPTPLLPLRIIRILWSSWVGRIGLNGVGMGVEREGRIGEPAIMHELMLILF